jgi:hypothetical protein
MTTAHEQVFDLIMAGWGSQAVRALAAVSVAEHMAEGPVTADALASREGTDPGMTYRLLRAGVALGLATYDPRTRSFGATPLTAVLHGEHPESLKRYALAAIGPAFWRAAEMLPEAVRHGRNYAPDVLGSDVFGFFAKNPQEAQLFGAAMSDLSGPIVRSAVPLIRRGQARVAVDVGGADGAFVTELVRANPGLGGVVLDLPHAVDGVAASAAGLDVRAEAGDFFDRVPPADIFLVKHILHDWDDESCLRLLSVVRRAMNPGARVYVVEMVMEPGTPSSAAALMDMAMLFASTGSERDMAQYESLLTSAGLRQTAVHELRHPYRLIEAVAA